ncbi:SafA/ExsA family spore coat assembly protein [Rossellomorea sp. LJF3]|uniref:SafA/ExsA family spore coat assembly protein n=1 Tax=Rossellomorea sp. LJF3 TaxID=3126099 RepID=UPI00300D0EA0
MKTKLICTFITTSLLFSLFGLHKTIAESTYIVKKGDTLWTISRAFQIGLSEMIRANPQVTNPNIIYPGQNIKIPSTTSQSSFENRVTELTNMERKKNGLPPLQADRNLSGVALYKSRDMRDAGYFSHRSPTYGTPEEMMKRFHIAYSEACENIAAGQMSPEKVVRDWMDSPVHRKNILNKSYTHVGVGYAKGGTYGSYWTQLFIAKSTVE